MPRFEIEGSQLLWGESRGVRLTYAGGDEAVVLASRNEFPAGDLAAGDSGELEGWSFGAPPFPTSYNVYIRQTTKVGAGGAHTALRGTQMLRQNYSRVPWERPFYDQKLPLITGDPLPDVNKDSRIPRPVSIRAEAVTVAGALGYPAGSRWLSYAGIVGSPTTSPFVTSAAPPVQIELSQGQIVIVILPDIPEAWTGIALLMSPQGGSADDLRIQRRIDLRGRSLEPITLSGPYYSGGLSLAAGGRPSAHNRTYIAGLNEFPAPRVYRASSSLNLAPMNTRLCYRYVTSRGQTASQRERAYRKGAARGQCVAWRPTNPPRGATRWIPEFMGDDGKWYTLASAQNGIPLNREARIHTNAVSTSGGVGGELPAVWKRQGDSPVELARQYFDESGIEHPKDPLEEPEIRTPRNAGSLLAPGRYSVRTTNSSDDESRTSSESAPSDPAIVTLRDSGIARGQAATGVTDQAIRVYRPPSQEIANARFTEISPVTGLADLEWEVYEPAGITVTAGEGVLQADDVTGAADIATIRGTRPLPIGNMRLFYVRHFLKLTRAAGGRFELRIRFADENNAALEDRPLLKQSETTAHLREGGVWTRKTVAPARYHPDIDMPAGTYYVQLIWRNVGLTDEGAPEGRDLSWEASQIGLYNGPAGKRKRYPLDLGLAAPSADPRPVPATEPADRPDLPGAYCRIVEDPPDGAPVLPQEGLIAEDFGGGPDFALQSDGSVQAEVVERNGTPGAHSLRLTLDSGTGFRHVYGRQFTGEFLALESSLTVASVPTDGVTTLLYVAGASRPLVRANLTSSGQLALLSANGDSVLSVLAGRGVTDGDRLHILIGVEGVGTAGGRAVLYWRKNGQRMNTATGESLDLRGEQITGAYYGLWGTGANASARVYYDSVEVSRDVPPADEVIPGNYIEYYGPEGTPRHPENFATGMRIPVTAGQTRTVSAYLGTEGAGIGTSLLKTAVKDAAGNVLLENPYLSENLRGDNYWFRASHTYTVPRGGAYLEFVRNNVGEGLVRGMGFQDEAGPLTPFTNENATDGYLRGRMRVATPGAPVRPEVWLLRRWLGKDLAITHEEDDTRALTSHQLLVRTADTEQGLSYAPWRGVLENIPLAEQRKEYVEMEVALYSSDPTLSPTLRGAFVDIERVAPVLTRQDGSEFTSGVLVYDIQPMAYPSSAKEVSYADGGLGVANYARGGPPASIKVSLRCFARAAAEEVTELAGVEDMIVERNGERYTLSLRGQVRFQGEYPGHGDYQTFVAEAEAIVVGRERWE